MARGRTSGKGASARSRCSVGYILPLNGSSVIKMSPLGNSMPRNGAK